VRITDRGCDRGRGRDRNYGRNRDRDYDHDYGRNRDCDYGRDYGRDYSRNRDYSQNRNPPTCQQPFSPKQLKQLVVVIRRIPAEQQTVR